MNGWGNDFVVFEGPAPISTDEVRAICDRRFGVGADGVLIVSAGPPIRMEYWNADGTPAEMCGNGLRCVARFARDRGMANEDRFDIVTPVGPMAAEITDDLIAVEIGRGVVEGQRQIEGTDYHLVDVGNPHAVTRVDTLDDIDVTTVGARVGRDASFPNGANVEFISVADGVVDMRVWERGVGETLACGSGMVAAAAVAMAEYGFTAPVRVNVPGGSGLVEDRGGRHWLKGPVSYSFYGTWPDQG
jgi:diaminopimelate epimerase